MLQGFTWAFLNSLFKYDRRTGQITRRVARGPAPAGAVVGTIDGKGYLHVAVERRFIRLHRLAWFLAKRKPPPPQLDHRDNDKRNNRIGNLRPCTCTGNAGNASLHRHNTSGYRGVSLSARSGLWHAQIKIAGKQTYLGRFEDPRDAARCYDKAARKHFGKFAKLNNA